MKLTKEEQRAVRSMLKFPPSVLRHIQEAALSPKVNRFAATYVLEEIDEQLKDYSDDGLLTGENVDKIKAAVS